MSKYSLAQRLGLMLLGLVISLSMGVFIIISILNATILNRGFVSELAGSRVAYNSFEQTINEGIRRDTPALEAQEVSDIIEEQVSYDDYKQNANELVGSIFDWLSGITETITFDVQLTEDEADFRTLIENLLIARLQALPVCQTAQESQRIYDDPFEASCRPAELNEAATRDLLRAVPDSEFGELYEGARVTDEDLNINEADLEHIQQAYGVLHKVPLIMLVVATVCSFLVLAVLRNWPASLQTIGKNLMRPSVTLLSIGLLLFLVFNVPTRIVENLAANNDIPRASLEDFASFIESTAVNVTLLYAGTTFVVGLVLYLTGRFNRGFEPSAEVEHAHTETKRADFNAPTPEVAPDDTSKKD